MTFLRNWHIFYTYAIIELPSLIDLHLMREIFCLVIFSSLWILNSNIPQSSIKFSYTILKTFKKCRNIFIVSSLLRFTQTTFKKLCFYCIYFQWAVSKPQSPPCSWISTVVDHHSLSPESRYYVSLCLSVPTAVMNNYNQGSL